MKLQRFGVVATLAVIVATLSMQNASAVTLFTTTNDFSQWSANNGTTIGPVTTPDSDGSTVNGLGNTSAPGGADTAGALQIQRGATTGNYSFPAYSTGEQGNAAFIAALENASTLTFDFTYPAPAGSYFQLGIVANYDAHFDQVFGTEVSLGNGWTRATINWAPTAANITAQQAGPGITYFQLGMIWNSDYATGSTTLVDNITVVPEPSSLALAGLGIVTMVGLIRRRRVS